MTDVFTGGSASFDQPSYVKGALMTMTLTPPGDTETVISNLPVATVSVTFKFADSSTTTVNFPVPPVSQTIVSNPAISSVGPVVDSSGRVWTINTTNQYVWTAIA